MGADAAYSRYVTSSRGRLEVTLSRTAWGGPDVPGHVRIVLLPLRGVGTGRPLASRTWEIHSGGTRVFSLPTPRRFFRVAVHIEPTFSPSQFGEPDTRHLGAQVVFRYRPAGG
jgi:hypothetical protein